MIFQKRNLTHSTEKIEAIFLFKITLLFTILFTTNYIFTIQFNEYDISFPKKGNTT